MTQLYNKHDLSYIKSLKKRLNNIDKLVLFDANTNTYEWVDKVFVNNMNQANQCKSEMIKALISDLIHNTKKHTYNLYDCYDSKTHDVTWDLFTDVKKYSKQLKLKMLELFEGDEDILGPLLKTAYQQKDSEFILEIFKNTLKYNYLTRHACTGNVSYVMAYHQRLVELKQVSIERIQESFITRLKHSDITDEMELIEYCLQLFDKNDLPSLLQRLNIKDESLCLSVEPQSYSKIKISPKTLLTSTMNEESIMDIAYTLQSYQINFPQFYLLKHDKHNIFLMVEAGNHNEKKVIRLMEELIARKYCHDTEQDNGTDTLLKIASSVSELVHLDSITEHQPTHKSKSLIKI
jgi:hypothetical protein